MVGYRGKCPPPVKFDLTLRSWGFPDGKKKFACQCWRHGFNPRFWKIPWRRTWQPTPVFLPGKSHGQRSLVGYRLWGHKESETTELNWIELNYLCKVLRSENYADFCCGRQLLLLSPSMVPCSLQCSRIAPPQAMWSQGLKGGHITQAVQPKS